MQLQKDFSFADAAAITDYLADLGITHLYCSPYLQARADSTHGYDVVDHARLNEELGGDEGHRRLLASLNRAGLGHILDVVPNHMTISERGNRWWWDVLENGPVSNYAHYFDIDWDPPEGKLRRSILLPILGDHYGHVLEAGELSLERTGDDVVVRYYDNVAPISPQSLEQLFGTRDVSDDALEKLNADADALHDLLEAQHYRLAYWRTAARELNYRRFFAINELAALRVEDAEVFEAVHELVLSLVREGRLDGLRIDHIDGLRRPHHYLDRLRAEAPHAYIVVEKILEPGENLPKDWPVQGTTGYDFLNRTLGLFVDRRARHALTATYADFADAETDLEELRRAKKVFLMNTELATDIDRLTDDLVTICQLRRRYRDYTRHDLHEAITETIAAFRVYRTYVDAPTQTVGVEDRAHIEGAVATASRRRPDIDPDLLRFLEELLLLRHAGKLEDDFAMRFQQTTGPVMAKGIEDTLFYSFNRLVALNEVGGDPGRVGVDLDEWHRTNQQVQDDWPRGMNATSTHDTKRGEDARVRIALLSEVAEEWAAAVQRWRRINERQRTGELPDRNAEYVFYQTLVGAWPLDADRATRFMEKASKEAKEHTSWIDPSPAYDDALRGFVQGTLADPEFLGDFETFVAPLVEAGRVTSLAQVLLKLTAPGVPDVYQGSELWDLSLVDPDNRRPVDYQLRHELLARYRDAPPEQVVSAMDTGAPKQYLIRRALSVRHERPEAFGPAGTYTLLHAHGAKSDHAVAFTRGDAVITVAPRLVMGLANDWSDTTLALPEGTWHNIFGPRSLQGTVPLTDLLTPFPVALLVRA